MQGKTMLQRPMLRASIICILAAMFYLYEFTLQVSPSVMTADLMRDFGLNAASLGAVVAFYYYAYTPMQLPAGLLYDRFGPRALLTIAILVCATGGLFFSLTNSAAMVSAGRFLMGIGSAFSFIGALLLVSRWFPLKYFALLAGFVQLMSSIGAIAGEVPLAAFVEYLGWRHTIMLLSVFGVLLAFLVFLVVRDAPESADSNLEKEADSSTLVEKKNELQRLKQVCGKSQTWLVALYSFSVWAPITAFAALWGIPFLKTAYNISTQMASICCAMIWVGIGIGSPLIGLLSDKFSRRCLFLAFSAAIGVFSLSVVIYVPDLSYTLLCFTLFLFGLAASGQSLAFGVVKDINDPDVMGTAIGFNNMAVVAGGALFQPLIGILLHLYWNGLVYEHLPVYAVQDYRKAFVVLPLCYVAAFIVSRFFIRETHCQHAAS